MKKATLIGVTFVILQLQTCPGLELGAAEKPAGQLDWEKTLQAAKQEAQIVIYAAMGPYHPQIFTEFQKDYPEIKGDYVGLDTYPDRCYIESHENKSPLHEAKYLASSSQDAILQR